MTLYDLQPGFEEDMGLLRASANWEMDRNFNFDYNDMNKNNQNNPNAPINPNNPANPNVPINPNAPLNPNTQMKPIIPIIPLVPDNQYPGTVNVGNQVLAMAYVPYQEFTDYFTSYTDALENGSLFKNLVKPFTGRKIGRR